VNKTAAELVSPYNCIKKNSSQKGRGDGTTPASKYTKTY